MNERPLISVVSPVYRAEGVIPELVSKIRSSLESFTKEYEIILVNDSSPDNSWSEILKEAQKDDRIKGIDLSRNFGQHQAILCGLENAKGEWAAVIDCDLQEDPASIAVMYKEAVSKKIDVVFGIRKTREHSRTKNVTAKIFNSIFNYLIEDGYSKANSSIGTLSLISRKVIDAFCSVQDYRRHYLMTLRWLGFRSTVVDVPHEQRKIGKSSYTLSKLLIHAIEGITYQSDKLLRLNITVGFIIAAMSFIGGLVVVALYFTHGFLSGWTSLIVTLFFMLGIILISIGILGMYIGKIFDQVKNRPKFIVQQTTFTE